MRQYTQWWKKQSAFQACEIGVEPELPPLDGILPPPPKLRKKIAKKNKKTTYKESTVRFRKTVSEDEIYAEGLLGNASSVLSPFVTP